MFYSSQHINLTHILSYIPRYFILFVAIINDTFKKFNFLLFLASSFLAFFTAWTCAVIRSSSVWSTWSCAASLRIASACKAVRKPPHSPSLPVLPVYLRPPLMRHPGREMCHGVPHTHDRPPLLNPTLQGCSQLHTCVLSILFVTPNVLRITKAREVGVGSRQTEESRSPRQLKRSFYSRNGAAKSGIQEFPLHSSKPIAAHSSISHSLL